MFNTGLRTSEVLGVLNSDVDLDNRVLHLQHGVKEVSRCDGVEFTSGREVKVGKLKSASSKRDVPLNQAAGRFDQIVDATTGGGSAGTLHLRDHRAVLCAEGHGAAERDHRGLRVVKEPTICAAISKEKSGYR